MSRDDDLEDVQQRLQLAEAKLALRETQLALATGANITGTATGWSRADIVAFAQQQYIRGEIDVYEFEEWLEEALGLNVADRPDPRLDHRILGDEAVQIGSS